MLITVNVLYAPIPRDPKRLAVSGRLWWWGTAVGHSSRTPPLPPTNHRVPGHIQPLQPYPDIPQSKATAPRATLNTPRLACSGGSFAESPAQMCHASGAADEGEVHHPSERSNIQRLDQNEALYWEYQSHNEGYMGKMLSKQSRVHLNDQTENHRHSTGPIMVGRSQDSNDEWFCCARRTQAWSSNA